MNIDLLIKNGMIVDPTRNFQQIGDIGIKNGKIIEVNSDLTVERVIDAGGCLVLPGLIDFHAHVYSAGTEFSIDADTSMLPLGVTCVVDAGSAGYGNYQNFVRTTVGFNQMHVFSFVNVATEGQITLRYDENVDPKYFDVDELKSLFIKYPGVIRGLKIRMGKDIVGNLGLEPLRAAVKLADIIDCPVVVHVSDPPCTLEDLAAVLRPGDVFCHCFQAKGTSIIDKEGLVSPGIKEARERGVIFDAANGKSNFSFKVARAAIADGFLPDIISTDLTKVTLFVDNYFGLPYTMSKYIALGVNLLDVVKATTTTPAAILGMQGIIGILAPGALADISIFKFGSRPTQFTDVNGETCMGNGLLIPQMTILDGNIVYRQIEFNI